MTGDVITVVLACGCAVLLGSGETEAPMCREHSERRVSRVVAPPPRITAVDCNTTRPMGPHVHHAG